MNEWELPSGFKESLILVPDSRRTDPFKRRVSQSHPQHCCKSCNYHLVFVSVDLSKRHRWMFNKEQKSLNTFPARFPLIALELNTLVMDTPRPLPASTSGFQKDKLKTCG